MSRVTDSMRQHKKILGAANKGGGGGVVCELYIVIGSSASKLASRPVRDSTTVRGICTPWNLSLVRLRRTPKLDDDWSSTVLSIPNGAT